MLRLLRQLPDVGPVSDPNGEGGDGAGDGPLRAAVVDQAKSDREALTNKALRQLMEEMAAAEGESRRGCELEMLPEILWQCDGINHSHDCHMASSGEGEQYSDDDDPEDGQEALAAEIDRADSRLLSAATAPPLAVVSAESEAETLSGLPWRFVITREARQSWASLPWAMQQLVVSRLHVIGSGTWVASGLSKLIRNDDRGLDGMELWRVRITKGGRLLFEVAITASFKVGHFGACGLE